MGEITHSASVNEVQGRTCGLGVLRVLGSPVSITDRASAFGVVETWVTTGVSQYVCVADVHSIMVARTDRAHRQVLDDAGMVLPDGMPLVWTGRLRGERLLRRVCGPDFLEAVCTNAAARSWRHFFIGGADGVAQTLADRLRARNPDLQVCGAISPPFRSLSAEEDSAMVEEIAKAEPHIVWVGLGCPKQERWMRDHIGRLPSCVLIGVGAAFDFHAGRIHRAPKWMRTNGLEWLHRLCCEPRRLWRRYLLDAPLFASLSCWETLKVLLSTLGGSSTKAMTPETV